MNPAAILSSFPRRGFILISSFSAIIPYDRNLTVKRKSCKSGNDVGTRSKERGWHLQYDGCALGSGFLRNPAALIDFNSDFYSDYLVERLSGVGIVPPEIETLQTCLAEREQLVQTLSAQIQMLLTQLAEITGSRAWKRP